MQVVIVAFVIYPLTLLKRLNSLRFTSLVAIICIAYIIFVIVFRAVESFTGVPEASGFNIVWAELGIDFFRTIPIVSFAFTFHMQLVCLHLLCSD
jgi:amino acid permease